MPALTRALWLAAPVRPPLTRDGGFLATENEFELLTESGDFIVTQVTPLLISTQHGNDLLTELGDELTIE